LGLFAGEMPTSFAILSGDSDPKNERENKGELRSPSMLVNNDYLNYCLEMMYQEKGDSYLGRIEVKVNGEQTIFESIPSQSSSKWIKKRVSFFASDDFHLLLIARVVHGSVSVAKLQVTYGLCPPPQVTDFECTFEHDACGFTLTSGSNRFSRILASTLKDKHVIDHHPSRTDNHVLALHMIANHEQGDAHVKLPPLSYHSKMCVRFWMNSDIPIQISIKNGDNLLFDYDFASALRSWFGFEVQLDGLDDSSAIDRTGQLATLTLIARYRSSLLGYVALDDFYGYEGECSGHFCNFEDRPCLWTIGQGNLSYLDERSHESEIELNSEFRVIPLVGQLPYKDHSSHSTKGHILYHSSSSLYSSFRSNWFQANSDSLDPDPIFCLQAFYFAWVSLSTRLAVLVHSDDGHSPREVHEFDVYASSDWMPFTGNIRPFRIVKDETDDKSQNTRKRMNFYVQLLIQPHFSVKYVMLDDISLTPGQCPDYDSMFACSSDVQGKQVSMKTVCDQRNNCPNGADEQFCGDCLFQDIDLRNSDDPQVEPWNGPANEFLPDSMLNVSCRYQVRRTSNSWAAITSVRAAKQVQPDLSPADTSSWVWIGAISPSHQSESAHKSSSREQVQLYSPYIRRTYADCTLRFRLTAFEARLSVWIRFESLSTLFELWTGNWSTLAQSQTISIPVGNRRESFQFIFLVQSNATNHGPSHDLPPNQGQEPLSALNSSWPLVLLHSIEMVDCKSKAPAIAENEPLRRTKSFDILDTFEQTDDFTCRNLLIVPLSKLCDLRNDCDDESDESDCSYDTYRTDFSLMNSAMHWNDAWQVQKTVERLAQGPTLDRSSHTFVGYHLILHNHQSDLEPSKSTVRGSLAGFTLYNLRRCTMRFAYQARVKKAIRTVFKWTSIVPGDKRGQTVIMLPEADQWTMVNVPFDMDQVGFHFFFTVHVRLSADDQYFAIDDISFTTDCYGRKEKRINCQFSRWGGDQCNWQKFVHSQEIDFSRLVTFERSDLELSNSPQVRPMSRYKNPSRLCMTSPPVNFIVGFFGFAFGPTDRCKDQFSKPESAEINLLYEQVTRQQIRLVAPLIVVSDLRHTYLSFSYVVFGYTFDRLRLWDQISNVTLLQVASSALLNDWVTRLVPLKKYQGRPIILTVDIQLLGSKSYAALHKLWFNSDLDESATVTGAHNCTFDLERKCDLLDENQLFGYQWIYSLDRPLPVADQTLKSTIGSFIYATSDSVATKRLWFRFMHNSKVCISFWHTNFVLDRQNNALLPQPNDSKYQAPFELSFDNEVRQSDRIRFRSRVHLNGEWRHTKILVDAIRGTYFAFKANFFAEPSDPNYLHAIAIDDLKLSANCEVVTCVFGLKSCDWRNSDRREMRQWVRIDSKTCDEEQLRFCAFPDKSSNEMAVVDFGSGSGNVTSKAELISSQLSSSNNQPSCMQLFYAFESNSATKLSVVSNDGSTEQVWATFTPQTSGGWNIWNSALIQLNLNSETGSQELRIRAEIGQGQPIKSSSIVAIRNILYHHTSCDQMSSRLKVENLEIIIRDLSLQNQNSSTESKFCV
jgi:hypothetical protein